MVLYLSYFYKAHELSLRLGFFWLSLDVAEIVAAFLGAGLLNMGGLAGVNEGWRWLFLVEGLMTAVIGVAAFVLMPCAYNASDSVVALSNLTPRSFPDHYCQLVSRQKGLVHRTVSSQKRFMIARSKKRC